MTAARSPGRHTDGVAFGSVAQAGHEREQQAPPREHVEAGEGLGQPELVAPGQQQGRAELERRVELCGDGQRDQRSGPGPVRTLERITVTLQQKQIHAEDCAECETREGMLDQIDRVISIEGALDADQRKRLMEIAKNARCTGR